MTCVIPGNRRTAPQHHTYPPEALDKASTSGSNLTRQTTIGHKPKMTGKMTGTPAAKTGARKKETTGALHGHFTS
jgi:hypothetical protein